ncbi:FAS1-like dehydratase domain-containing protein [Roseovarius sp. 2305UL8-3]|uniref:FAS1-like dehydratase domain-containing protein n=1 Tax=Roseovarius conchicola TaxID=3121636 RepID=UPI003528F4E8
MDQINVIAWEGRSETLDGCISQRQAAQIHATLGKPGTPTPTQGEAMPQLWHWCAFPPAVPMNELARDGHPMLGDFLPPVKLERRMWASGRLTFGAPLRVGEQFTRRSTIAKVSEKEGATGPMVFVTVDHQIYGDRGLVIEEQQDIVYLAIPDTFSPPKKRPLPETPVLHETAEASEALLFRYSAITFNAHRIHYDLPYAREVEHYPGLVIHGPLQAMWLIEAARAYKGRLPQHFDFRGVHPCLLTPGEPRTLDIMGVEPNPCALELFVGQAGHQTMQATAIWEETQ